ncbi:hypothetical protein [Mycolicibacterium elephantis]
MKASELFSHLDKTELTSNTSDSDEPVKNPVFSDQHSATRRSA